MRIIPIKQKDANKFVADFHDHHDPVVGSIFQIGLAIKDELIGIAICGRPSGRKIDHTKVIEATRVCINRELDINKRKNACSKLYGAAARIAKEMGYQEITTYVLKSETGISLKAAGWFIVNENAGGKEWNSSGSRIRTNVKTDLFGTTIKSPNEMKVRWSKLLSSEQSVQECDASKANQGVNDDNKKPN